MTKRFAGFFAAVILAVLMSVTASAEEQMARDITSKDIVAGNKGIPVQNALFDMELSAPSIYATDCWLQLEHPEGIGSLYIIFDVEYGVVQLTNNDTEETIDYDTMGVVHRFIDVEKLFGEAPKSVTIKFCSGTVKLNELRAFTPGMTPEWVQRWEEPFDDDADLCLFSTHADDEQLFFGGILPYYSGELGYHVQVVYFTNHRNLNNYRVHEALNGLWAVGVRNYPVFGTFPDVFTDKLENAYGIYHNAHVSDEKMEGFVVEQLRRFKPLVAVGHDFNGEYSHGVHMLYTDLLVRALEKSNDPTAYPETAEKYGTWDVPKTYIHLYEQNPIVMDWDRPLSKFDGKTAFEVSRDIGWPNHVSQQAGFVWFYNGATNAKTVERFGPCNYGLLRTLVGDDVKKDDFFENITRRTGQTADVPADASEEPETQESAAEATQAAETAAEETQPEVAQPAVPQPRAEEKNSGNWLKVPAIGALILLAAAALINLRKK